MVDLKRCLAFYIKVSVSFQLVELGDDNLTSRCSAIELPDRFRLPSTHLLASSGELHGCELRLTVAFECGSERWDDVVAVGGEGFNVWCCGEPGVSGGSLVVRLGYRERVGGQSVKQEGEKYQ